MIKTIFAAAAAAPLFAGAAIAGPYVNVEANSSWTGNDYTGTTTDVHVGYEGEVGAASYYVQGRHLLWSLWMVLMLRLVSLVKQDLVFLFLKQLESMVNFLSSLQTTLMTLVLVEKLVLSIPSNSKHAKYS